MDIFLLIMAYASRDKPKLSDIAIIDSKALKEIQQSVIDSKLPATAIILDEEHQFVSAADKINITTINKE